MFRLVRFFLVTSAMAAVAVVVGLVIYRQGEVDRLIGFAERQNVTLAQSFANMIWPRFAGFVTSAGAVDGEALLARPEIQEIHEAVQMASRGLPILKVKIYNLEGLTVYSTDFAEIGEDKTTNPGVLAAARRGKPASKLTFRDSFSSFEGTVQHWDLVESYLPIRRGDGPVEGIVELYTDVTSLLASVRRATINLAVGFLAVFGLLYGVLFIVVQRADRTIKQQYTDITEKNEALRHEIAEREQVEAALKDAQDDLEQRVEERTRDLRAEIAERKRAEDEARRHRNVLAHFGRVSVMGEMATSLAHELNQPLTVISGCAQLCLDRLRADAERPERLVGVVEQLAEQAERANEIIRRIRGFIQRREPERREIDVNETILGVSDLLRTDAREHGTEIALDLAAALPRVLADPIQVQQVILNLAHNGIEAMSDRKPALPRLTIRTAAFRDGAVEIAVHDEGAGISPAVRDRIFEPFFTTKSGGLGMGLSISRSIVEAHGGSLWAASGDGAGAVFRFTIPVAADIGRDAA